LSGFGDETTENFVHLDSLPIITIGSKVLLRFIIDGDDKNRIYDQIISRPLVTVQNGRGQLSLSLSPSITTDSSFRYVFLSCTVISMDFAIPSLNNITVSIHDSKEFYANYAYTRLNRGSVFNVSLLDIYTIDRYISLTLSLICKFSLLG